MPRKGSKTITVNEALHQQLAKGAEETRRTIPGYIESLVDLAKRIPLKQHSSGRLPDWAAQDYGGRRNDVSNNHNLGHNRPNAAESIRCTADGSRHEVVLMDCREDA